MTAVKKLESQGSFDSHSTFNFVPNDTYPKQKYRLLDALAYLEKLRDSWIIGDAKEPTSQAISMARHFINCLFLTKQHADYVEPDADGGIILKWENEGRRVFLTIDGIALHASYEEKNGRPIFIDDIPFFSTDSNILPTKILEYIPNIIVNA